MMVSSRLVVGLGLLASSLANPCTKKDVAPDPSGESATWSLAGCTSLDLSCPPTDAAAEASPCNNSLVKGDIDSLALALGESGGTLSSIELRGNWLGPHGANLLSKALAGHASLTSLGLASCRAGDYGIMALVKVLLTSAPPQLERVDLSHNSVGDVGARELSTLLEADALPKLIEADLSWNGIGPRGGRYLGTALASNTGLQSLKLDWNGLMDRGARAIGEGLATNSGLQTLSLEHNAIKNEGGRALAQGLRTNGALKALQLDSNGISRAVRQEVATAIESMPEAATAAEERRPDESGDDIEEISFDDDAEEEAPARASAAGAGSSCVDHGPWDCVETNCPSATIDCPMLFELGLCDNKFSEVWEESPPAGLGSQYVWQQCSKACKRCGGHEEL